ncbi:MAG TPA: G1 family glutamic endopeptidase, partial [Acidimicrobiales bacterium]|nr:G1 family glutamic endopeptidase [Acidimicrobiales bacterium]
VVGAGAAGGTAAAAGASSGIAAPVVAPMIPAPSGVNAPPSRPVVLAANWSGYVAASKAKFDGLVGRFTQPTVSCTGHRARFVGVWTGLDGYYDATLEQDGTFGSCTGPGHKTPTYVAWYEMYPAQPATLFPVDAGDTIVSAVTYADGRFTLSLKDTTSGQKGTIVAACQSCRRSSAEWIVERPELCTRAGKCFLPELPDFGTVTVSGATATVEGGSPAPISGFTNTPIDMYQPVGSSVELLDQTGALSKAGDSFSVVWQRTGKPFPL